MSTIDPPPNESYKPQPKSKVKSKLYITIISLLAILLVVYFTSIKFSKKVIQNFAPKLIKRFEEKTNRKILVSNISFISNSIYLNDIIITKPNSKESFFKAKRIELIYDPYLIITSRKFFVDKIKIDQMKLDIEKKENKFNFVDIIKIFGEKETPIYQRFIIKEINIQNSEMLFKENKDELLLNNINIEVSHILNTPLFAIKGNFEAISVFRNLIINGEINLNTKIKFVDLLEEIKCEFQISKLKLDKIFIDKINSYLEYKNGKSLELKTIASQINGFSDYNLFKDIEKNYSKVFSKKLNSTLNSLELRINLSKYKLLLNLITDLLSIESIMDFNEQKHIFNMNFIEIKLQSNSIISKPIIKSNASETFNEIMKNAIKIIENFFLKIKEDI